MCVTRLNRLKKKLYHENKFNDIKNDCKKLWNTFNELMGGNTHYIPSFLEVEGNFLTKPTEKANYFKNYFINKIDKLKNNMTYIDNDIFNLLMRNKIIKEKHC